MIKRRYIASGKFVFIVPGKSGKEYPFEYIDLRTPKNWRKLNAIQGRTIYLLINDINLKFPFLLKANNQLFQPIEQFDRTHFNELLDQNADCILYLQDFENNDFVEILEDITEASNFAPDSRFFSI